MRQMTRTYSFLLAALVVAAGLPGQASAQARPDRSSASPLMAQATPPAAAAEPEAPAAVEVSFPEKQWRREILRVGNDFTLAVDDGARAVTVVGGDLTLEGRVAGDVVVVLGHAEIAPTAFIDGSLVVVGGSATISDGVRLRRDLVIVGGRFNAPANFAPGGDFIVAGPQVFNERFSSLFEWLTRGALWGRLIVPGLWWVWVVLGVVFLVYLVIGILFEKPVREIAETLAEKPVTTFVVGFFIALVTGPVCVLLGVSVVGIAVIPLVLVALCAAWVLGKIGTARWIGRSMLGPAESPRADAVRSFFVGFVVVSAAYLVPVLGLITFTMLSVLGIGAASMSFLAAYRRESPVLPTAVRVPAVVPAMTTPAPVFSPDTALAGAEMPMAPVLDDVPIAPPSGLLSFPKASFRDRLAAGVLDLILIVMFSALFEDLFDDNRIFAFMLAYFIGFWTWKGTTVGGIICQLRIVRVDNQPIRFVDGLVRGLSGIFSLMVVGLGFLWILRDADRQAWHDRIAGTYVVKVPRNWTI